MHPEQSLPWRRRVEEDVHVLGVVDDDVALLLPPVDPAHNNDTVVLIHSSRPGRRGVRYMDKTCR